MYSFVCTICKHQVRNHAGLSSHMFLAHGVKCPCRRHVSGTVCPCCLTEYHSRERLIRHLVPSQTTPLNPCRAFVLGLPPLPQDEFEMWESQKSAYNNVKKGLHPLFAHLPAFRVSGPRPYFYYATFACRKVLPEFYFPCRFHELSQKDSTQAVMMYNCSLEDEVVQSPFLVHSGLSQSGATT